MPENIEGILVYDPSHGGLRLTTLCGMTLASGGPARVQGPAVVSTLAGCSEGEVLTCRQVRPRQDGVEACFQVGASDLELRTRWRADMATGVVSRRDALVNKGSKPCLLTRCLVRVAFPSGSYECYSQTSRWCRENQGAWQPLHSGVTLRHAWGRTTEEATPYLALRSVGSRQGLAFHVLPCGNWTIRVCPVAEAGAPPFVVVELGLADENLRRVLQSGETFELPEVLIQSLPQGEPHLGAPVLHRYLLAYHFVRAKTVAPVVYNTWFDQFEILDVPQLRKQLAAAKKAGCEVFVVDAGWYGAGGPNWWAQAGDWREKTEAAFRGRMRVFADTVRSSGLGFGLWMEPERFGQEAPIRNEHPEWFIPVGGAARMDLTQPAAYGYLRGEIGRLVETYQLAWMKLDFNFILDADASGAELADYTAAWYRLLEEIRSAYPKTFFEGCASGALRGDLAMLSHVDGHFLSDTVNSVDMLRISQGAWLRLPPGRLTRWAVLRSPGPVVPRYGMRTADSPPTVLVPGGALWEPCGSEDLDFAILSAMPGILGFSGDLAGMPDVVRERLAEFVRFYKRHRRFLAGAVAHLLSPPQSLGMREGWIGFQLQDSASTDSLIFVYRLGAAGSPLPWKLRDLVSNGIYEVVVGLGGTKHRIMGRELMEQGLTVTVSGTSGDRTNAATVVTVRHLKGRVRI